VGRYQNSPWAREISLAEAIELVERVRESAALGARESLQALAAAVPMPITSIAIRVCPKLPPTTEERIADNRAQTVADSVMYREALASAVAARGWSVYWYDRARVSRRGNGARLRGHQRFTFSDGPINRAALAGQTQARGSGGACSHGEIRAMNDRFWPEEDASTRDLLS
jgi:hypothetical protein